MKILVPTDLSPLSKVAVLYAANLAVTLKAQLILLHIFHIDVRTRTLSEFGHEELIKTKKREKEVACLHLLTEIREKIQGDLQAVYSVEEGNSLEQTINRNAMEYHCDLIVMGTKGKSGLKKTFLGNSAAAVIRKSAIPVLTVPEMAFFNGINDIVYATDMINPEQEFDLLLPLAKIFDTRIHIVHVHRPDVEPGTDPALLAQNFKMTFNYAKIEGRSIMNTDVKAGIEEYLKSGGIDMLCVFSGKRNFYERIFEKSSSRQLVFQNTLPILTISKNRPQQTNA